MLAKWSSSTNDVNRMIPSKLSSMHRIVVMVRFVYGLVFHNLYSFKVWTIGLWLCRIRPWLRQMFLDLHPVLSFRRVYLSVYFSFESNSWTVHPCVQGIYSSMLVCLSWIILDECIKEWRILIQLCTYMKIHHIYIWKSKLMQIFVHRYGTCSRASALENKHTNSSNNSTKVEH